MRSQIMYIEQKSGLTGPGRIRRVRFSKTGKTLYVGSRVLRSLKGLGYKANYVDVETSECFWVSRPKKNGQDTLYPGVVTVDDDVRHDYWRDIRARPELVDQSRFRSGGKHRRWRQRQYEKGTRR